MCHLTKGAATMITVEGQLHHQRISSSQRVRVPSTTLKPAARVRMHIVSLPASLVKTSFVL
ncbi:hypothetical protein BDV27DRAFT_133688 [Aspergillus caelatus]|uniref:Uncharacterized protein n=1 Tax=Aspergillus caelatus TaxID=61420 RepID=A0A5N6ZTN0_9EURO|nr:uncharacterized protein BDV27DRAFT_133688 [Aspergillus caelatus]KAE8360971.1 hypothetical protein BDV27DRAFT_133688 [Aspergillus caelatus]